jgi:hypothetical protein
MALRGRRWQERGGASPGGAALAGALRGRRWLLQVRTSRGGAIRGGGMEVGLEQAAEVGVD